MIYRALRRVLFLVPPERIHTWVFARPARASPHPGRCAARLAAVAGAARIRCWQTTVFGVRFPGPLGLAAGFDKDGTGLNTWGALGFGYAEVGTVTAQAQPGNPQPRMFRLRRRPRAAQPDGLQQPRRGRARAAAGAARLRRADRRQHRQDQGHRRPRRAVADYAESARLVGPLAAFLVVNVSSPNTPGLRDLQAVESLRPILAAVRAETTTPVLVKIAPDLSDADVDEIADLAVELGLAGHRRHQHHGVARRAATPRRRRAGRRRHLRAPGRAPVARGAAPAATAASATGWC